MATRTVQQHQQTQHLTVQQLAHRINVTPDYLYREVLGQPDGIPFIRLGDGRRARIRILLSDVERWEESRRVRYGFIAKSGQK